MTEGAASSSPSASSSTRTQMPADVLNSLPPGGFGHAVRAWWPCVVSLEGVGVDGTTVQRAAGGTLHVQLPAPQLAAASPEKPTFSAVASLSYCPREPVSKAEPTIRWSWAAGRAPTPLAVRLDPPAAHERRPQRAPPGPQSGESATRSRSATPGAGRGQRVRGGASGAGSCRAEPSRAEPSRAARCRGEAGRACRWLRTHRAAFPGSLSPCLCPGARKTFIVSGSPGVCDEIASLRCRHARGHRRSRGRATFSRRRALAPCASSPADRSRESRGGTPKRTARASAPRNPVHRCGPARRNFNLIPVAHPEHPRRPPPPPSLRSHKERGEERRRGRRARASGLPRQKGNCHRSGRLFRPVVGSSSRPGLPLRLGPCGLCPQCSDPASCGARVAAAGWGSRDNK
ncbi:hypothetical protein LEMLEM_LOCUS15818 [Lemmus lemmus]